MLDKNYELVLGPPPMDRDDYQEYLYSKWTELMLSKPDEPAVQRFLEMHPAMIPGATTPTVRSGHSPLYGAVVSQPKLAGIGSKIPDFMWIAKHSQKWYPTLIEIESPNKLLYTKQGQPTAKFTQAQRQLADWRAWFDRPENLLVFSAEYGIPRELTDFRQRELHLILIFGRQSEFENDAALSTRRASLMAGPDHVLVSYDSLRFEPTLDDAVTIKCIGAGRFRVLHVSPLFRFRPHNADRLLQFTGVERAIRSNELISSERKNFLCSRLEYWRNYAAHNKMKFSSLADWE